MERRGGGLESGEPCWSEEEQRRERGVEVRWTPDLAIAVQSEYKRTSIKIPLSRKVTLLAGGSTYSRGVERRGEEREKGERR